MHNLHALNQGMMVLIPKILEASSLRDYRPISLIQIIGKLISKIFANRLAGKLLDMVHRSQSPFISGCYIQDNFQFVHVAAKLLHAHRKSCLLVKIDIVHAFDSVAWQFLLEVLEFIGFLQAWRGWVSLLLPSSSTKVMLNGVPGDFIAHCRGLRQGNPLSPMMFLLVMEVLSALVHKADDCTLLHSLEVPSIPHHATFYADDLILFVRPELGDIRCLKEIIDIFHGASGLGFHSERDSHQQMPDGAN
jgi:hypothetical protein